MLLESNRFDRFFSNKVLISFIIIFLFAFAFFLIAFTWCVKELNDYHRKIRNLHVRNQQINVSIWFYLS